MIDIPPGRHQLSSVIDHLADEGRGEVTVTLRRAQALY